MTQSAETAIRLIDRQIDAVRRQLCRLETVNQFSAASWQAAWDAHPVLRATEKRLFLSRGRFMDIRDNTACRAAKRAEREAARAYRTAPRIHCSACGQIAA